MLTNSIIFRARINVNLHKQEQVSSNIANIMPIPEPKFLNINDSNQSSNIPANFSSKNEIFNPTATHNIMMPPAFALDSSQHLSKKKKKQIDDILSSIKDKPDHQIDYFSQRQKVKDSSKEKQTGIVRMAADKVWRDATLEEWDKDDFRLFVGNIGYEIVDEHLSKAFSKYASFQKAKVIRNRKNFRSKGYGFVSFKDPDDFLKALKEMDGVYIGVKPIKLSKSNWKERNINVVKTKQKQRNKIGLK